MLMYASWNARAVGLSLSANESIKVAARAGFTGVDLLVRDLAESNEDPLELRSRMDDLGLRGGAWPLPVDWRGNTVRFREDIRQLPRYARTAAILGLSRTGTWVLPEIDPMLLTDEKPGDSVAGAVRRCTSIGWARSPRSWPTTAAGSVWRSSDRSPHVAVRTRPSCTAMFTWPT